MEFDIIYEDKNIIAYKKQYGIPSQPDRSGDSDLKTYSDNYCKSECFIINRLDRPVGGIVLFAKNKTTAADLTNLLTNGKIEKYYIAVVCGSIQQNGIFEDYIVKNSITNRAVISSQKNNRAKKAMLEFEKLSEITDSEYGTLSIVKIHLLTGRHHQIRVQFSHRDFPIWGDTKYNRFFINKKGYFNIALWSYCIKFKYKSKYYEIKLKPEGSVFDKF